MTDNVTDLPRSTKLMSVGWREHTERLKQMEKEITKLCRRLEQESWDFYSSANTRATPWRC